MRNNVRIMRKNPALDALFPKTRQGVLSAVLAQPDKWWFLSELAAFLGTRPSSLQREVVKLLDAGILEQRREGVRSFFRAQRESPIYLDLQGIFSKTSGMIP